MGCSGPCKVLKVQHSTGKQDFRGATYETNATYPDAIQPEVQQSKFTQEKEFDEIKPRLIQVKTKQSKTKQLILKDWNKFMLWSLVSRYLHRGHRLKRLSQQISLQFRKRIKTIKHRQYDGGELEQHQRAPHQEEIQYLDEEEEEEEFEEEQEEYETPHQETSPLQVKLAERRSSIEPEHSEVAPLLDPGVKRAQTQNRRLTIIDETLREQSEMDSIDKKDRQSIQNQMHTKQVPEFQNAASSNGTLYTETDGGQSFEHSVAATKPNLKKKEEVKEGEKSDHRYVTKAPQPEDGMSQLSQMPSFHENPMLSLKSAEDFEKFQKLNKKNHTRRPTDPDGQKLVQQVPERKPTQEIKSETDSGIVLDSNSSFQATKRQTSLLGVGEQHRNIKGNRNIPKKITQPPKMHLKETIQYSADVPAPTIRIFEEVNNSLSPDLSNSQTNSNISGPQLQAGEQSPKVSGSPRQFFNPVGPKMGKQIESDPAEKEKAYNQFKQIYENRLKEQNISIPSSHALQKQDVKSALQYLDVPSSLNAQKSSLKTQQERRNSQKNVTFSDLTHQPEENNIVQDEKPHVDFQKQRFEKVDDEEEVVEDKQELKSQMQTQLITIRESEIQEDPTSGVYTHSSEIQDLRHLSKERELATLRLFSKPPQDNGETQIPLYRLEMKKKQQQRHNASVKKIINQSMNANKVLEAQSLPTPQTALLQSLQRQMLAEAQYDPQQFKNVLMNFLCQGMTEEVISLLKGAPNGDSRFRNCEQFYFSMFHSRIDQAKDKKMISPIAVAVNVGDPILLSTLIDYLENVNIEFGLEIKRNTEAVIKQHQKNSVRKKSPLQFACSMGLFKILDILLQNGSNPNGVPESERFAMIEYDMNPLVICMSKKRHNLDLEVEGLAYKQRFNKSKEVDHVECMKLLLKYKADTNAEIRGKRRKPRPIFHACRESYSTLKLILDNTADRKNIVNQVNYFHETPLCLVAGEQGQVDNDMKTKLLLDAGASCFASELNPLHIALKFKNLKVMRVLYRQGDASPARVLNGEQSPLHLAILQNDHHLVRELLHWKELSLSDILKSKDQQGHNIMHVIAENKSIDVFRSIISETKNKFLTDIKDALNESSDPSKQWLVPLSYCYPNIELARLFIRYGADPLRLSFIHCFNQSTSLDAQGNPLTLDRDYLLFLTKDLRLNPNEIDSEGLDTVAHCYLAYRKDHIAFLVTQLGASLEMPTMPQGRTVLLDSAFRGHIDMFEFLLSKGADPNARDGVGKSLAEYIKNEYGQMTGSHKTSLIKDKMAQALYKNTLSKPFKQLAGPKVNLNYQQFQ